MRVLRGRWKGRFRFVVLASLGICLAAGSPGQAQIADLMRPKQHLTIERPGSLSDAEALTLYQNIRKRVHAGYRLADYPAVAGLCEWPRYNRAPYLSATHGGRYTMIMPDGSLFGTTKGEGGDRVQFCITCHEGTAAEHHQMFFVPPAYRVENLTPR